MSTLYIIATPIGNLEDITLRAVRILREVDALGCEDTRHSLKLMNHLGIKKPLFSCRAQNEAKSAERVIRHLEAGETVAYISDAGTPALSDPGSRLVRAVRDAGFTVVPIPGPSAFAALISVAGFSDKSVTFEGFLSPKGGKRRKRLRELLERDSAFLLYESPFRVVKLLTDLADLDNERNITIGREMTKTYEEFLEGTAGELRHELEKRKKIQGEFSVLVSGAKKS